MIKLWKIFFSRKGGEGPAKKYLFMKRGGFSCSCSGGSSKTFLQGDFLQKGYFLEQFRTYEETT